jgi:hypothetical protein
LRFKFLSPKYLRVRRRSQIPSYGNIAQLFLA